MFWVLWDTSSWQVLLDSMKETAGWHAGCTLGHWHRLYLHQASPPTSYFLPRGWAFYLFVLGVTTAISLNREKGKEEMIRIRGSYVVFPLQNPLFGSASHCELPACSTWGREVSRMCFCSGPRGACPWSSSVRRLEDLRTLKFLSIACQVEWHYPVYVAHCTWQKTCLIWSDGKEDRAHLQSQRGGPQGNQTRNSDLGFPLASSAQLSEVSLIPRLVLFLVMTWLEPSQDKCSHHAPVGRERHSPRTEQTVFWTSPGLQDSLKPVPGKLWGMSWWAPGWS